MPYRRPTGKDWERALGYTLLLVVALILAGPVLIPLAGEVVGGAVFAMVTGVGLYLLIRWHAGHTAYRCQACGHEFEISMATDLLSLNLPGAKYLRCPRCRKRSWATVLMKD